MEAELELWDQARASLHALSLARSRCPALCLEKSILLDTVGIEIVFGVASIAAATAGNSRRGATGCEATGT